MRLAVATNPRTPDGSLHGLRTDTALAVAAATRAAAAARRHAPQPARAAADELAEAIDLSADPAFRGIVQTLAAKEERAERRAAAREARQVAADAPLVAWIGEVKAGTTELDFAEWEAVQAA